MSVPKSVVKIKKSGVEYVSSVDRVNYTIIELVRAALRDSGNFIVRNTNYKLMKLRGFKKGNNKRIIGGKNRKGEDLRRHAQAVIYDVPWAKQGLPHADIGITHDTWYGVEQEIGSSKVKRQGLLRKTVQESIAEIVKIQSQYLSALEDEARALSLIDEEEYTGGGSD